MSPRHQRNCNSIQSYGKGRFDNGDCRSLTLSQTFNMEWNQDFSLCLTRKNNIFMLVHQ